MQVVKYTQSDKALARLVMAAVTLEFGIPEAVLYSPTKGSSRASFARQIGMYLTHIVYEINLSRVARVFGRDRSTVSHACRVVEEYRDDPIIDEKLNALESFLTGAPSPAPALFQAGLCAQDNSKTHMEIGCE